MRVYLLRVLTLLIVLAGLVWGVVPTDASQVSYLEEKDLLFVKDATAVINRIQPNISTKVGDSAVIATDAGDIIATPHTLSASGWVTVQYNPKILVGEIEVSFGFNGKDNVQITKVKGKVEQDIKNERKFQYQYVQGMSQWQTVSAPDKVVKGNWYEIKYWVELPFGGLEGIEGKYNIEVKQRGGAVGSGVVLDPWYNSAWGYRKVLTVYGSSAGVQTDFQKLIRVYKNNVGADTAENIAQYTTNNDNQVAVYTTEWQGQSFTAESTVTVKKAWLKLVKTGSPTATYTCAIRATNATFYPTGADLCSGTLVSSVVSSTANWYMFDFGIGTTLTSGTQYSVILYSAGANNTHRLDWTYKTVGAYTGGRYVYSSNSGSAWNELANADKMFQIMSSVDGATPLRIDCEGNCKDDFSDIRFTRANSVTLIDHWVETYVAGSYADIWVELNTIAQMAGTSEYSNYFMYYGNSAATSVSSGTNTFDQFDNFDSYALGSDMNGQGGWTASNTIVSNTVAFSGAQSARVDGNAASSFYRTLVATSQSWFIGARVYKTASSDFVVLAHGDGNCNNQPRFAATESVFGADRITSLGTGRATEWTMWREFSHIWGGSSTTSSAIVQYADSLNSFNSTTNAFNAVTYNNVVGFATFALGGAGEYLYIDDVFVAKFAVSLPLWGVAGAQAALTAPTVATLRCTGFGTDWLLFNGNVTSYGDMANITQLGFDYDTTTAFSLSKTDSYTNWTMKSNGYYTYINGLNPQTTYWYRAKAYNGAWAVNGNWYFSTCGSPQEWERNVVAVNSTRNVYGSNWVVQRFTTNITAHTLTDVELWLMRYNSPGDITVSLQGCGVDGKPYGNSLSTGTIAAQYTGNINPISTNTTTRYKIAMTPEFSLQSNTTYCLTVKALMGDINNYITVAMSSTYAGGTAYTSTDNGLNWSDYNQDFLFDTWGNGCLRVDYANVFQSFKNTGDWLIVFYYYNKYPPSYPIKDPKQYFSYQLVDVEDTVVAQSACVEWGGKPGSIYLSSAMVSGLEWSGDYRVRLVSTEDGTVYMEYPLQSDDWMGNDLSLLDAWVLSIAQKLQTDDATPYITAVAGRGSVLNSAGGVIFATGIPYLDSARPSLFQIVSERNVISNSAYPQTLRHAYQPAVMLGPDAFGVLTAIGNIIGQEARTIGAVFLLIIVLVIAGWGFQPGHTVAATVICMPIFIVGLLTGLIDLLIGAIGLAICAIIFIWKAIFTGG